MIIEGIVSYRIERYPYLQIKMYTILLQYSGSSFKPGSQYVAPRRGAVLATICMVAEKGIPALRQYGVRLPRARRPPAARLPPVCRAPVAHLSCAGACRAPVARLPCARRPPVARPSPACRALVARLSRDRRATRF